MYGKYMSFKKPRSLAPSKCPFSPQISTCECELKHKCRKNYMFAEWKLTRDQSIFSIIPLNMFKRWTTLQNISKLHRLQCRFISWNLLYRTQWWKRVAKQTLGEVYMTSTLMSKILYQPVMTVFKYFRSKYSNSREGSLISTR
jgi:hypothetical protein